jgi:hypothetical protein
VNSSFPSSPSAAHTINYPLRRLVCFGVFFKLFFVFATSNIPQNEICSICWALGSLERPTGVTREERRHLDATMLDRGKGKEKDGPDGAPQVDSCPFLDCWLPLYLRQVLALTAVLLALVAMIGWFQCGWVSDDHDVETAETLANKGSLCSYEGASFLCRCNLTSYAHSDL